MWSVHASKHTSIHTHARNEVTLVWGSLRLAPITYDFTVHVAPHEYLQRTQKHDKSHQTLLPDPRWCCLCLGIKLMLCSYTDACASFLKGNMDMCKARLHNHCINKPVSQKRASNYCVECYYWISGHVFVLPVLTHCAACSASLPVSRLAAIPNQMNL